MTGDMPNVLVDQHGKQVMSLRDVALHGQNSLLSGHPMSNADPGTKLERRPSFGSMSVASRALHPSDSYLLGPKRPRPHKIWKKKYIKVMVVGDSGLGKTTLVRALLSTPGERMQVHDGTYTSKEQWLKDPESLCSTVSWRDEEDRTIWVYKIQDTPGYGDDLDVSRSINLFTTYIEEQNYKWLEMEQSSERKDDMSEMEDPRVDICIFAIPPHRLRAVDIKVMFDLGQYVPLVPVITKADTMTIREATSYRNEVDTKLSNPMIPGVKDKINVFKFERDTMERAGITDHATPTPPFLIVASNDINEDLNTGDPPVFWPERRYPWGTAEAFNREHSDLLGLRALLLKEALEEVNKTKRQRYEGWRRKALNAARNGRRLRQTLLWTIIPALACLHIGRTGLNISQVRKHVSNTTSKFRRHVNRIRQPLPPAATPAEEVASPAPMQQEPQKQRPKFGVF
ncbi:septin-like protein [Dunaliella salina]|uniref:Septin-like protein n=1 Tax=Dunaliella salina TaxID=3046 RepID=A0ABQ7H490_DUNSA|nr:septin-like protein [Dunaliella salina]|eukprot:KAF5841669.1 septin-like protein [Dunaliella salina]